jgi:hypothetical protein
MNAEAFYDLISRKLEVRSGYKNIIHLSRNGVLGCDILNALDEVDGFCKELGYSALDRHPGLKHNRRYLLVLDGDTWKYFFIRQAKIR